MGGAWLREEQADLAADRILDAASVAFRELGVSRAGMGDIAHHAGCSRATLYRYFRNRHELQLAYVNRSALELAARVEVALEGIEDPRQRLVEGIVRSVREVRDTPGTAAWFVPGDSAIAARMSGFSEVVEVLAGGFVTRLLGACDDETGRLRARWLVRVIVSLLTAPGASAEEERELIERFVAPSILAGEPVAPTTRPAPAGAGEDRALR